MRVKVIKHEEDESLRTRAINMLLSMISESQRDSQKVLSKAEVLSFLPFTYKQIVQPLVLKDRRRGMSYQGIACKYSITYHQAEWICKSCGVSPTEAEEAQM